jgi:tyrosyl-tRNA synthetase
MAEIRKLEALGGAEINEAKKILAYEVTKLCHGEAAAKEAAETARKVFEEGASGGSLPTLTVAAAELAAGILLTELLVRLGFAKSGGEARRQIEGNGAYVNDNVISDFKYACTNADMGPDQSIKISWGKKKHALIKLAM